MEKLISENGQVVIQVLAMPKDTNPHGDIFGGWLLSQMDIAGGIVAGEVAKNRVVTIGLDAMSFIKPVFVGDVVKCYAVVERIGNTSITILVKTFATRVGGITELVTQGRFTYVSINEDRKPKIIKP